MIIHIRIPVGPPGTSIPALTAVGVVPEMLPRPDTLWSRPVVCAQGRGRAQGRGLSGVDTELLFWTQSL